VAILAEKPIHWVGHGWHVLRSDVSDCSRLSIVAELASRGIVFTNVTDTAVISAAFLYAWKQ